MGKFNTSADELKKKQILKRFSKYKKFKFLTLTPSGRGYCDYCNSHISRIKKYNVENHEKSEKHKRNEAAFKEYGNREMVIEGDTNNLTCLSMEEKKIEVSKVMGEYLLKGYRMLSECCEYCHCILLQDLKKINLCIECDILNMTPQTPRVSTIYINENDDPKATEDVVSTHMKYLPEDPKKEKTNSSVFIKKGQCPISIKEKRVDTINGVSIVQEVSTAITSLKNKLNWASLQLDESNELQECQQAAATITQITNALVALKSVSI